MKSGGAMGSQGTSFSGLYYLKIELHSQVSKNPKSCVHGATATEMEKPLVTSQKNSV